MIEKRAIKFYLDESVNAIKKEKIIQFLKECQNVENQLITYYWNEGFNLLAVSRNKIQINYNNKINYKDLIPRLKSHHFQQVLQQVYDMLKSIQSRITNDMYFHFDDKEKQKIYNYCKGFCFDWNGFEKYIDKQLKAYKKKDNNFYKFISIIKNIIDDEKQYDKLKNDIESKFYEMKKEFKLPLKKEFQIKCNTFHTVDINEDSYYQWIFTIDNNTIIGGSEKKGIFDKIIIPVKFSDYHRKKLKDKTLGNTFNLKLNKYNKIEIIGHFEVDIIPKHNEINNMVGVDIGLKKLIMCSDGEVVEQNPRIVKKLKNVVRNQTNRKSLQKHIRKKSNDDNFQLPNKNYLKKQRKLTNFVKIDTRYRIKQFLKGRENDLIIMEDLDIAEVKTPSKVANNMLRRLHIQEIKNDMLKYCKQFGINIETVNPAYTSQQCPICNHISKENRKTQEKFCCVKCNHIDNADHNASINIMNRYGDERIKSDTPFWKIKDIIMQV